MIQEEIYVKSTLDGTEQPSLYFEASAAEARPLIIGLHTWSSDRTNCIHYLLPFAEEMNFNLLLPEFRGPNFPNIDEPLTRCGSEHAKRDIKDAIDYILATRKIDKENIFLIGLSGGGHMAMLMAGYCPEYFKAIASLAGISDLGKWQRECVGEMAHYAKHISGCTGDKLEELYARSPINYIDTIAKANIKLFHGRWDNVVPPHHSIDLYNAVSEKHPDAKIYLDIFNGVHQYEETLCKTWILSQYTDPNYKDITG